MNVNCKQQGMYRQCNFLSVSCTKPFKHAFTIITEISFIHVWLKVIQSDKSFAPKMRFLQKEKIYSLPII